MLDEAGFGIRDLPGIPACAVEDYLGVGPVFYGFREGTLGCGSADVSRVERPKILELSLELLGVGFLPRSRLKFPFACRFRFVEQARCLIVFENTIMSGILTRTSRACARESANREIFCNREIFENRDS